MNTELKSIDVDQISTSKRKFKRTIKSASVQDMADSVRAFGVLQPVVVREKKDGGYELLAGSHRLKGAKAAELSTIPATVVEADDIKSEMISIEENIRRYQPDSGEMDAAIKRLKELHEAKHGKSARGRPSKNGKPRPNFVKAVAVKAKISERRVRQSIARSEKLDSTAQRARDKGDLTVSQADELTKLPKQTQRKLVPQVKGKTREQTRALVATAKCGSSLREDNSLVLRTQILAKKLTRRLEQLAVGLPSSTPDDAAVLRSTLRTARKQIDEALNLFPPTADAKKGAK